MLNELALAQTKPSIVVEIRYYLCPAPQGTMPAPMPKVS